MPNNEYRKLPRIVGPALGILLAAGALFANVTHVNGFSVSVCMRNGGHYGQTFAAEGVFNNMNSATIWGKLAKFTLSNGQPIRCDTLFHGLANNAAISFDGRHVAFYRLGATVNYATNKLIGTLHDSGWISVVDTNGRNLRNLARVATLACRGDADWEYAHISWPSGDWVYYERPCKTGEIWRVNVNDPARTNELVVKYVKTDRSKCCYANCGDFYDQNRDSWAFRRFSLSKSAARAAGDYHGYVCAQNYYHCFPPPNGDFQTAGCLIGSRGGCNAYISPSGKYCVGYPGGHESVMISMVTATNTLTEDLVPPVNHYPKLADLAAWTETRASSYGLMIRWAANSDKWILQEALHYNCASVRDLGSDQVATNWVDSSGIVISRNVYRDECYHADSGWDCMNWDCLVQKGWIPANDAGDLFIDCGAQNIGKYEDVTGAWVSIPPVQPIVPPSGTAGGRYRARDTGRPVFVDAWANIRPARGGPIEISDVRGRIVFSGVVKDGATIAPPRLSDTGCYFVTAASGVLRAVLVR